MKYSYLRKRNPIVKAQLIKSILFVCVFGFFSQVAIAQCGSGNFTTEECRNKQTSDPTDDDFFPVVVNIPNDPANYSYDYSTSSGDSGTIGADGGTLNGDMDYNDSWPVTITVTGQQDNCTEQFIINGPPSCSPWNCDGLTMSYLTSYCQGNSLCFDIDVFGSGGEPIEILRKLSGDDDPTNNNKVVIGGGVGDGSYTVCIPDSDIQADYPGQSFFTMWVHALDASGMVIFDCVADVSAPIMTCSASCVLTVDAVTAGPCYWDGTASVSDVTISVSYMDAPAGESIDIDLNGMIGSITPSGANGSDMTVITVPADGASLNVSANFNVTTTCMGSGSGMAPPDTCTPNCSLTVDAATPGACYWDGTQSLTDVSISVSWMDAPSGEDITVDINGTQATISTSGQMSGSGMTIITMPADGSFSNAVSAFFNITSSCSNSGVYDAPAPCAPACLLSITSVSDGGCYYDGTSSLVDVTVSFTWSNAPSGEDILIDVNGYTDFVFPSGTTGSDMVTITLPADGSIATTNIEFSSTTTCADSNTSWTLAQPCTPDCNLSITAVQDNGCTWDGTNSITNVDVFVVWSNAPVGEDIEIEINGNFCTIPVGSTDGNDLCSFTLPADNSSNNVFANFTTTNTCAASDSWNAPPPCVPECNLFVTNVSDGGCYWDGSLSLVDVTVDVTWSNAPVGEDIDIYVGNEYDVISVGTTDGSGSIVITVPANGASELIDVFFQITNTCSDGTTYGLPFECEPPCSLTIDNVVAGGCVFDGTNSLVNVDVTVSYNNAPSGEDVDVFVDGTTVTFTPASSSGTETILVVVGASGNNGAPVSANFQTTTTCFDVSSVDIPPSCSPNCELFLSVNPGNCYWDGTASLVDVDVNVSWANAPSGESIDVDFAGNIMVVTPTGTPGNETITFTVAADGSTGTATANFQTTTVCEASGDYALQSACAPNCTIMVGVMEGMCYLDAMDNSLVDVIVNVLWTDAPTGENIDVDFAGVIQSITVSSVDGMGSTTFTVAADGSSGTVSAAFNPTSTCFGSEAYMLPNSCLDPVCDITNASATVECFPNGTPLDPSDDIFRYMIEVTGSNTATSYNISGSDTQTGLPYGMSVGPFSTAGFPISGGDLTLDIVDGTDATCTYQLVVAPPLTCSSDVCSITPPVPQLVCDPNGTLTDESDDLFKYSLNTTGMNISSTYSISGDDSQPGMAYNTLVGPFNMAGFPISGGAISLTLTDDSEPTCTTTITVNPPATCSNDMCSINQPTVDVNCLNNGTLTDPSDDLFQYTINVTGNNIGMTYDISGDDTRMSLGYNGDMGPFSMSGFPISGGAISLTITDTSDPACSISIMVDPPDPCSDEECSLNDPLVDVTCLPNGTLSDPSDDLFEYTINVSGQNTGSTYTIMGDDMRVGLGYDVNAGPFSMAGFPISGGDLNLTIQDDSDPTCTVDVLVEAPVPCSEECMVRAEVSNVRCNDNGTPFVSGDDYILFDLTVEGSNISSSYIVSTGVSSIAPSSAPYNSTTTFQMDPGTAGMNMVLTLRVEDSSNTDCRMYVDLQTPGVCSEDCTDPNCFNIRVTRE